MEKKVTPLPLSPTDKVTQAEEGIQKNSSKKNANNAETKFEKRSEKVDVKKETFKEDPSTNSKVKPPDIDALLKEDHRKVEKLFQEYESADNPKEKSRLSKEICMELIVHTILEEELFYPACRAKQVEDELLDEAQVEHDGAKVLITELITLSPGSAYYDAKVKVLSEYIKHHVGEEEDSSNGIFTKARNAGVDMSALGNRLQSCKKALLAQGESALLQSPFIRSLEVVNKLINAYFQENETMNQNRDNQGRFRSNDDRHFQHQYAIEQENDGRSNRYDSDHHNHNDGRSSLQSNHSRNSYGHNGNYGSYSPSGQRRYQDDDRNQNQSNDHGYGGWLGDSGGHSQPGRRENQFSDYNYNANYHYDDGDRLNYNQQSSNRGSTGNSDHYSNYDDDSYSNQGGYSSHNRNDSYDDDYNTRLQNNQSRGEGQGWHGDSEGHSEAARRGHQSSDRNSGNGYNQNGGGHNFDSNRHNSHSSQSPSRNNQRGNSGNKQGHGGWFGDPEGHSQAARKGYQSSDRGNNNGSNFRSQHSSSRNHQQGNNGNGNNQGHGGWFGDSQGHAEAARRGWENRD